MRAWVEGTFKILALMDLASSWILQCKGQQKYWSYISLDALKEKAQYIPLVVDHECLFIGPRCPWGPIYGS